MGMKKVSGIIFGYDPGGNGKHGVAKLEVVESRLREVETSTHDTAEMVIKYIKNTDSLKGLGVDTLTCWSTGDSGWRPADRWLLSKYTAVRKSVISPNGLYGSMGLNGMAMLFELRKRKPDLFITETHPKVLFRHFTDEKYDYKNRKGFMNEKLAEIFGLKIAPANEHEFDALISAYAALKGMTGQWTHDLHQEKVDDGERIVRPCGETHYFWPV